MECRKDNPFQCLHSVCSMTVERAHCLISLGRTTRHVWPRLTHLPLRMTCPRRASAALHTSSFALVGRPVLFSPSSSERRGWGKLPRENTHSLLSLGNRLSLQGGVASETTKRRRLMNCANNTKQIQFSGQGRWFIGLPTKLFPPNLIWPIINMVYFSFPPAIFFGLFPSVFYLVSPLSNPKCGLIKKKISDF